MAQLIIAWWCFLMHFLSYWRLISHPFIESMINRLWDCWLILFFLFDHFTRIIWYSFVVRHGLISLVAISWFTELRICLNLSFFWVVYANQFFGNKIGRKRKDSSQDQPLAFNEEFWWFFFVYKILENRKNKIIQGRN